MSLIDAVRGDSFVIGIDYGTESARGVLLDAETGEQVSSHVHRYPHGVMTDAIAGTPLAAGWALQDADDYLEATREILGALGRDRRILSVGLDFTASSPLPSLADGTPLSRLYPTEPHAYVKLWKHSAQRYADGINARASTHLTNFGNRTSGSGFLAKGAQLQEEAPHLWERAERFIEAGDWLVLCLTGNEIRSRSFAAFKAHWLDGSGYPPGVVPGLADRLTEPKPIGSVAGGLSGPWRASTGIRGPAVVAVAVIDSHAVLPAVDDLSDGTLTASLGTSAVYLYSSDAFQPLPQGLEGAAFDASLPDRWCYEAGQAGFGDCLAWFARTFPGTTSVEGELERLNMEASKLVPGESGLIALDWWSGNRVPWANDSLTGVIAGLTLRTTAIEIYRAILEGICFGARSVVRGFEQGGLPVERLVVTSGLASRSPFLVRVLADVLGRSVQVPSLENATCVGAAIHGAVAGQVVTGFREGRHLFGARTVERVDPDPAAAARYTQLFGHYERLSADRTLRETVVALHELSSER